MDQLRNSFEHQLTVMERIRQHASNLVAATSLNIHPVSEANDGFEQSAAKPAEPNREVMPDIWLDENFAVTHPPRESQLQTSRFSFDEPRRSQKYHPNGIQERPEPRPRHHYLMRIKY